MRSYFLRPTATLRAPRPKPTHLRHFPPTRRHRRLTTCGCFNTGNDAGCFIFPEELLQGAVWLSGCSFWLLCVSGCRTREGRSRRLRTRLRGAEDVSTFEIGVARCTQLLWWTTPKVSSWCALARRVGKAPSVCCWINGSATASPRLSYAFAEAIGGAKTFVVNHNDIMNTVLPPCTVHSNWPASLAV